MKPVKAELLLKLFSRISLLLSFYSLFWILWEMGWQKTFNIFFAMTMQYWILLLVFTALSYLFQIAAEHPEIRTYFTKIERTPKGKAPAASDGWAAKQTKVKLTKEEKAMLHLMELRPDLFAKPAAAPQNPQIQPTKNLDDIEKTDVAPKPAAAPQTPVAPKPAIKKLPLY